MGDFAFFKLISEYFDHKIDQFGLRLMTRMKIAVLLWVNKALNGILGSAAEGMTTQAMFQGGIGLLMTVLIVTAPPLAAAYFQGTLGNFMSYSAFAGKDPGKDRNAEVAAPSTQKIENETKTGGVSRPETGYMGGKNGENLPQQDKVKNTPRDKD
ncbi:hypothetical protein [Lysobacter capsici]|uniref:hypothetical protein n=1 Tax=Lysobacter capsici TaxID=435897 RepID=UPI000BBA9648|nr:hypothetical protein [Lysobacter capsici]ATE71946.1 hypothetical protein CNO08_11675 [Lysobacter capsici]